MNDFWLMVPKIIPHKFWLKIHKITNYSIENIAGNPIITTWLRTHPKTSTQNLKQIHATV